jgi:hypothetical protein
MVRKTIIRWLEGIVLSLIAGFILFSTVEKTRIVRQRDVIVQPAEKLTTTDSIAVVNQLSNSPLHENLKTTDSIAVAVHRAKK